MSIGLSARLVAKNRWGKVRRAYSQSLTSDEAIRRAQKAGGFKSVRLFHQDKGGSERGFSGDDSKARAIGLTAQILFPAAYNLKNKWRVRTGDAQYFREYSDHFDGPGLGWINHVKSTDANARAVIASELCTAYDGTTPVGSGGFPMLKNAPWSLEAFLPKPLPDDPCPVFQARWPGSSVNRLVFPGWVFQVIKGQAEICLLAPARTTAPTAPGWTQAREDQLFSLLSIENKTSLQQETIDEIRQEIYAMRQSVDFTGEWYDRNWKLSFYPEERGVLNVTDGAQTVTVRHPEIIKARVNCPLWKDGQLVFVTNGPSFFFRTGFPWFDAKGILGFGKTQSRPWSPDLPQMQFTVLKDVSGTGTSLTVANHVWESSPAEDESVTVSRSEVQATFSTTHRRYTPYLYAAHAYIAPGTRTGGSTVIRDTGDAPFLDAAGVGPIIDVIPQFENGRRTSYTVIVRDEQGTTFQNLGFWYDTLEGCVCDLYLDGERVLCDGIIQSARLKELSSGEYNRTRPEVTHPWTTVEFQIADQNAILDEILIKSDPVGDFQDLNAYNKKLLKLAGIANSKINFSSGGRLNPTARPGEDWATRPSKAVSLGDYLRRHNEKFGMGKSPPWIDANGIWQAGIRPTTVKTIDGHPAHFSSSPFDTGPYGYPQRFAILAPLENLRDVTDFYNFYTIEGGEDSEGNSLVATWEITDSIQQITNPSSRSLIGREREYYVSDSGLRTLDDVLWVRRSLVQVYGDHPRFFCFKTYYHRNLFPNDLITVDGTLCRIVRIPGGSARDDRMDLVCREVA